MRKPMRLNPQKKYKILIKHEFLIFQLINLKFQDKQNDLEMQSFQRIMHAIKSGIKLVSVGLKESDMFGYPAMLFVKHDDNFKTKLSGIASIAIFTFLFITFYTSVITYFSKDLVTSSTLLSFDSNPSRIVLDGSNFMFAVAISQKSSVFNQYPYYNVQLIQRHYVRDNESGVQNKTEYLINLEPCKINKFQKVFKKYGYDFSYQYKLLNFDTYLCPVDDYNITIQGTYTADLFSFVKFQVSKCVNKTLNTSSWNATCFVNETYYEQNVSENFNLYTTSFILNVNDPQQYIQPYLSDEMHFTFSPSSIFKSVDIFVQDFQIETDQNIFFGEDIYKESLYFKEYNDFKETVDVQKSPDVFGQFFMRRSYFSTNIQRSYQKFSDLISYLGGFTGIILPFFGAILQLYNRYAYIMFLANKIYNFDPSEPQQPPQNNQNLDSTVIELKKIYPSEQNKDLNQSSLEVKQYYSDEKTNLLKAPLATDNFKDQRQDKPNLQRRFHSPQKKKRRQSFENNSQDHTSNGQKKKLMSSYRSQDSRDVSMLKKNLNESHLNDKSLDVDQVTQFQGTPKPIQQGIISTNRRPMNTQRIRLSKLHDKSSIEDQIKEIMGNYSQSPPQTDNMKVAYFQQNQQVNKDNILTDSVKRDPNQIDQNNVKEQVEPPKQKRTVKELFNLIKVKLLASTQVIRLRRRRSIILKKTFHNLILTFRPIQFTFEWTLNKLCFGKFFATKQVKIVDLAIQKICEDLEVTSIVRQAQELDKLKRILFNHHQLTIFNLHPKHIINLNYRREIKFQDIEKLENHQSFDQHQRNLSPELEYEQIQDAYFNCLNEIAEAKGYLKHLNEQLIGALGGDLKQNMVNFKLKC